MDSLLLGDAIGKKKTKNWRIASPETAILFKNAA